MMGEAETVGEAQTVWRWYSGWGAMEETRESGWWHWLAPVIANFLWRRRCCQAQIDLSLFQVNSKQLWMGKSFRLFRRNNFSSQSRRRHACNSQLILIMKYKGIRIHHNTKANKNYCYVRNSLLSVFDEGVFSHRMWVSPVSPYSPRCRLRPGRGWAAASEPVCDSVCGLSPHYPHSSLSSVLTINQLVTPDPAADLDSCWQTAEEEWWHPHSVIIIICD